MTVIMMVMMMMMILTAGRGVIVEVQGLHDQRVGALHTDRRGKRKKEKSTSKLEREYKLANNVSFQQDGPTPSLPRQWRIPKNLSKAADVWRNRAVYSDRHF